MAETSFHNERSYIILRRDFPRLPPVSLPFYPRSAGMTVMPVEEPERGSGKDKNFVQLSLVLCGSGDILLQGAMHTVRTGDLLIQYPQDPRENLPHAQGMELRWLTFDGQDAAAFIRSYHYPSLIHADRQACEPAFDHFEKSLRESSIHGQRHAIASVTTLLATAGDYLERPSLEPAFVTKFKGAVEQFYSDSTADVNTLCAHLNIHRGSLSRQFHDMGLGTPGDYLRNVRIQRALEALALGTGIAETARRCGFRSTSYFSQIIRRITGETPKYFQQFRQ